MKEIFESSWKIAPQLMSVVVLVALLYHLALKISQFQLEFANMNTRLSHVEQKVDMIIEYLLSERAERNKEEKPPHGK